MDPPPHPRRHPHDVMEGTYDLTALCPTNMRNNTRMIMPDPRPESEECVLAAKRRLWLNTAQTYINNNCDKQGWQSEMNITPSMAAGIKNLRRRIKEGELVVIEADKGKVITVSSMESYM